MRNRLFAVLVAAALFGCASSPDTGPTYQSVLDDQLKSITLTCEFVTSPAASKLPAAQLGKAKDACHLATTAIQMAQTDYAAAKAAADPTVAVEKQADSVAQLETAKAQLAVAKQETGQ